MEKKIENKRSNVFDRFVESYENSISSVKNKSEYEGVIYTPNKLIISMIKNVIFWYFKEFFPDMEVYPSNLDIPQIVKSFTVSKRKRALKNKLKTIKILDPSVGTGRFLLYISKLLLKIKKELNPSRNISTLKKEIIKYNLYGFDIDEKSCIITKIKLLKWLFQDEWNLNDAKILNFQILNDLIEQKDIKLNIYNSDFLLRSFGTQKFDIVIGNPPYVENKKISDKKYKKILYNEFKSAYKLFDLSILFIEKSIGLLKDSNSLLSFILQNKFLSAEYGSKVREFILNSCQVKNIINLSNINLFKGVSAYPIVLTLKKGNSGNKNLIELVSYEDFNFENQSNLRIQQFSQSLIQKLPKKVIPIEGNPEMVLSLYKSFNSMEREIKDLRIIYRPYGFLNYKKYLKNFSSKKKSNSDLLILGTGNVGKYHIRFNKKLRLAGQHFSISYFSDNNNSLKPSIGSLTSQKIIFREIAKKLTCVFDPGIFTNLTGLYFIKIPSFSRIQLFSLIGILNSEFMNLIFKTMFSTLQMSEKYMRINGTFIKRLPLPEKLPTIIGLLSKINHFLSQLKYEYDKLISIYIILQSELKENLDDLILFFEDLTNSLVIFLYLSKIYDEIKFSFPNLNRLLSIESQQESLKFPNINFKYFINNFEIQDKIVYNLKEIIRNFNKIKLIHQKIYSEEKLPLEMKGITKLIYK